MATDDAPVVIRRMTEADLPGMRASGRATFQDLEKRLATPEPPGPQPPRPPGNSGAGADGDSANGSGSGPGAGYGETGASRPDLDAASRGNGDGGGSPSAGAAIVRQLLDVDAAGAWVATVDGTVRGAAMAGLREGLWYLAHLHVWPGYQGRGIGARLLDAALGYGADARGRLLHSSLDPAAMRCYQRAGFALEPAMRATGVVRRAAVPASGRVRPGDAGDLDLVAEIDRARRGAAHGPDLDTLLRCGARLLIADRGRSRGYALVEGGEPAIVAATDEGTASALLWAALAESGEEEVTVQVLRADQQWAIDVAHRAGLRPRPTGPLCRQADTGPLAPYLPHTGVL